MTTLIQQLRPLLQKTSPSSNKTTPNKPLISGILELDHLTQNQILPGHMIQWGLPLGKWGRVLPLLFLKNSGLTIIWINAHKDLQVYPPSWESFGLSLKQIYFLNCDKPLSLKPLFYESSYDCLVIDTPKSLKPSELAFLSLRARINHQYLFVIQNHFLSQKFGNPFAKLRINGQFRFKDNFFVIQTVKGNLVTTIKIKINSNGNL